MPRYQLSSEIVAEMYDLWLQGLSIRRVSGHYGIGRMAAYEAMKRQYGGDCCDLRKQSLARVVVKDYGDKSLASRARGIEGLYRTAKTENYYSRMQTTDLDEYSLYYEPEEKQVWLSLPWYLYFAKTTVEILCVLCCLSLTKIVQESESWLISSVQPSRGEQI